MHKIGAWYDAEAYFRRRAKSGRAFTMPIPGFGDVLFAAKPAHIREFLKIPVSAFTPPMPNPASGTSRSVLASCPRCTMIGFGATPD